MREPPAAGTVPFRGAGLSRHVQTAMCWAVNPSYHVPNPERTRRSTCSFADDEMELWLTEAMDLPNWKRLADTLAIFLLVSSLVRRQVSWLPGACAFMLLGALSISAPLLGLGPWRRSRAAGARMLSGKAVWLGH